jgi:hypothetical protein
MLLIPYKIIVGLDQKEEPFHKIVYINDILEPGAEQKTINRSCPVQINRMFRSKKNYFLLYNLYFLVN